MRRTCHHKRNKTRTQVHLQKKKKNSLHFSARIKDELLLSCTVLLLNLRHVYPARKSGISALEWSIFAQYYLSILFSGTCKQMLKFVKCEIDFMVDTCLQNSTAVLSILQPSFHLTLIWSNTQSECKWLVRWDAICQLCRLVCSMISNFLFKIWDIVPEDTLYLCENLNWYKVFLHT